MLHYFKLILAFIVIFSVFAEAKPKKKKNSKCPETIVTQFYKLGQKKARKLKGRKSVLLHHCVVDKQFKKIDEALLNLWSISKTMKSEDATVAYHFGKWGLKNDTLVSYLDDANSTMNKALLDDDTFTKTVYISPEFGEKLVRFETTKVSITLQYDNNKIITYHVK